MPKMALLLVTALPRLQLPFSDFAMAYNYYIDKMDFMILMLYDIMIYPYSIIQQ